MYAIHVCIACMFVERIHGGIVLCYFHSIYDFCIFGWVRSRSLRLVRLHRFCSHVGQVLLHAPVAPCISSVAAPHPTPLLSSCTSCVAPSTSHSIGHRLRRRRAPAETAGDLATAVARGAPPKRQSKKKKTRAMLVLVLLLSRLYGMRHSACNSTDEIIRQMCLCCRIVSRCLRKMCVVPQTMFP
jgi:hypothetical protein